MISDHFQKDHLDKLFDMGFTKHRMLDDTLTMTYNRRGEAMEAFITHEHGGDYTIGVIRLSTGGAAVASIAADDFPSFLVEELIDAEPGDESPGSGGGGGK